MDMSACDFCFAPGRCCSGIKLNSGSWPGAHVDTVLLMYVYLAASWRNTGPLMPLYRKPNGAWLFWCPTLTREGRCGDYEHRPDLCRNYEPMSDGLCVLGPPGSTYYDRVDAVF